MNFAIYIRKSVYTGKGESIDNQIEMCRQYIFTKFDGVTDADITIYEDEGYSAKNTDRPRFQQMLNDIKQKMFDFVVCYRLDRISRNVSDFSTLIEELNDRDISFVCIKEEFDTSKPMGKAMMYIASVFAQLERETIAERVRDNMLMLARTGRWLGGTTPMGFKSEKTTDVIFNGNLKTSCKLKTDPAEISIIKIIFEKFLELNSVSGVSKYLIKCGIKSRLGKVYSLPGIKEILQNPVYCIADKDALDYFSDQNADVCFEEKDCSKTLGLISYNKRDYKKKNTPRQPVEKWIIAIGKHKGVVPGKKWVAVQNILESNKPDGKRPANMHNDYSLLSGFIFCEKCEGRMFAKMRRGKSELFDYICQNKMRGGMDLCASQNLGGRQTDDMVCEYLMQYQKENSNIYKLLENLKSHLREQVQEDPISKIDSQIKKCNDEMKNLICALSKNNLSSAFVEHVNDRINELDVNIKNLNKERNKFQDKEICIDLIAGALSNFKDNFNDLSIQQKRTLIKLLVKKIIWDGKDLHIFIHSK